MVNLPPKTKNESEQLLDSGEMWSIFCLIFGGGILQKSEFCLNPHCRQNTKSNESFKSREKLDVAAEAGFLGMREEETGIKTLTLAWL